ncbi:MAG: type II secretion system protein [Patescibacteria group bacterium]
MRNPGFTLLELVIYLAIISGAILSFTYFILSVSNSRTKTYVAQEVHANGRTALEVISQRIRAANGIVSVTPTVLTLDFSTANPAKHPTAIDRDAGNTLRITEDTDGAPVVMTITSDDVTVTALAFTNLTGTGSRENIKINLTIAYDNPSGSSAFTYSKDFTTAVSVRQ